MRETSYPAPQRTPDPERAARVTAADIALVFPRPTESDSVVAAAKRARIGAAVDLYVARTRSRPS